VGFLEKRFSGLIYIVILSERSMVELLKPLSNNLLHPFVRPLVKIGIRPNHLTVAGLTLSCIAAWFVFSGRWTSACIIAVAGSLLDLLDGVVARESNQKSVFGAILDSSCDRLGETILLFGVLGRFLTDHPALPDKTVLTLPVSAWGIIFCYSAITLSLVVSYVKARCEGEGVPCAGGLLRRPERIILICVGLLAGPAVMVWILAVLSLLAVFTVLQRLNEAHQRTKTC
jgi:CDP-diacylglycerol---glycerol-3-phosphate 3-phosphatidyltransferase